MMNAPLKTARFIGAFLLAPLFMSACAAAPHAGFSAKTASAAAPEDYYAASALAREDWQEAALLLEARDDQDPYRLLNLALAYQNMGREAEALALYQHVMELRENPYANLGQKAAPRRVKSLAENAILALGNTDASSQK